MAPRRRSAAAPPERALRKRDLHDLAAAGEDTLVRDVGGAFADDEAARIHEPRARDLGLRAVPVHTDESARRVVAEQAVLLELEYVEPARVVEVEVHDVG